MRMQSPLQRDPREDEDSSRAQGAGQLRLHQGGHARRSTGESGAPRLQLLQRLLHGGAARLGAGVDRQKLLILVHHAPLACDGVLFPRHALERLAWYTLTASVGCRFVNEVPKRCKQYCR